MNEEGCERTEIMKILVDADACPVVRITEKIAEQHGVPVILYCERV